MADFALPATLGGEPLHPMTALCYEMLGPAMTAGDDQSGFLLLKLMDALVHELKPVWELVLDNGQRPGWWDVFNPYALQGQLLPWLPWLSQFTGDFYDASVNGINPSTASPDQINRNKVARRRQWNRGTLFALEDVILERIPQGALVSIDERVGGTVSHLHITIYTSSLITDKLEGILYQAIGASLPAGDTFDLDILTGSSFDALRASLPADTFLARQALYPQFDSLPAIVEAPYSGPLPGQAFNPFDGVSQFTWDQQETFITTWTAYESYATWDDLEAIGT